jgi:excisionase family DNA binding protein
MSALELSFALPAELVDAIAERVATKLAGQLAAPGPTDDWRLWNLEETAARLGRSERTVREWTKDGRLPHVLLDGGAYAFNPEDVKAFARARRVPLGEPDEPSPRRRLRVIDE